MKRATLRLALVAGLLTGCTSTTPAEVDEVSAETSTPDLVEGDTAPAETLTGDSHGGDLPDVDLDGESDGAARDIPPANDSGADTPHDIANKGCQDVVCGEHATCVEGLCVCDAGYAGEGCEDVDECATGSALCDPLVTCTNTPGSYTCGPCPQSHVDAAGDGTHCELRFNACGIGRFGPKASGTLDAPIIAPYLPMVDPNTTAGASSDVIDSYDCAPETLETGPEVIYRFVTDAPGTFHAELKDPVGVDVDIHLIQNPSLEGGQMKGCLARAHETLTVENLPAGEYWVVADTWSDGAQEFAGDYTLAFEWTAIGTWSHVEVDQGIIWSRLRLVLPTGDETINRVTVEMDQGWDVEPVDHVGCQRVADVAGGIEALAGINGTFYSGSCSPLGLLRADGVTKSTNTFTGYVQRTIGWNPGETPTLEWLEPNMDWLTVSDAIGGYPSLVTDGVGKAEALPDKPVWSDVDLSKNPRSAVGVDAEGRLVLLTFDGRTAAGDGLTTPELATFLEGIGLVDAINLDGGGSTTMVVRGCWLNDVVSYPSDNKNADHWGDRKVGNGLYVR